MQLRKTPCVTKLLFIGLCLIILVGVLPILWPPLFHAIMKNLVKFAPGSIMFACWMDNPLPIYVNFYLFNWTNQALLAEEGDRHVPVLQEHGPYHFHERVDRINVTWNDNNTLTYQQARWWWFDQENSKGSLDDVITTLNVVALTAAFKVRDWNYLLRASTSTALRITNQKVHVTRTARELLFDGYSDQLISIANTLPSLAGVKVPLDKFAWFYKRNGTTFMDGVFNMHTGAEDIQEIGNLKEWNYRNRSDNYPGDCGQVYGSSGNLFPPGLTRESSVHMFSPDLCRPLDLEYSEDVVVSGVPGYKYVAGVSVLDNGTAFPDQACFCDGECVPSGVVNVTTCKFGSPLFASFPHFYLADPYFTQSVRGMRPDRDLHQFYFTLEPNTGIPLDVAARFQINLLLQPLSGMGMYENVPTVFFPVVWFEERAVMIPSLALLLRPLHVLKHLGVFLSLVAALSGCLVFGYIVLLYVRTNRTVQLENEEEDSKTYLAAPDVSTLDKTSSKHYIVMRPAGRTTHSSVVVT